jgi:uncharacterized protein (TIGR03435 family)
MQGFSATMDGLAHALATAVGRPVTDTTNLTGIYDFVLEWSPDAGTANPAGSDPAQTQAPTGPTIFTAIQEQLGLQLKATRGPADMVVIDRAERPSAN